jgi:PKD repeat protein
VNSDFTSKQKIITTVAAVAIIGLMVGAGIQQGILFNQSNPIEFTFTSNKLRVDIDETIDFQLSSDFSIDYYLVDLRDGSDLLNLTHSSSGVSFTHKFQIEGRFLVTALAVQVVITGGNRALLYAIETLSITVQNQAPQVTIASLSTEVYIDEVFQLDIASIIDSSIDQNKMTYQWNFGNGQTKSSEVVTHSYSTPGTYLITVHAIDPQGLVGIDKKSITVRNVPPEARFTSSSNHVSEDESIYFDATQTTSSPSNIATLKFGWDFGDGTYASGPTASHQYTNQGVYTVTLTVQDQYGDFDTSSIQIVVDNQPPIWTSLNVSRSQLLQGQTFSVQSKATDTASDIPRLSYRYAVQQLQDNDFGVFYTLPEGINFEFLPELEDYNVLSKQGRVTTFTFFEAKELNFAGIAVDDDGEYDVKTFQTTFTNAPPHASILAANAEFNLTFLITGEKWRDAEFRLFSEKYDLLLEGNVTREAGSPWDTSISFNNTYLDLTHMYHFEVLFTPENDPINGQYHGSTPVKIILDFPNGHSEKFEYTFVVDASPIIREYLWEQSLDPFLNGFPVNLLINYYDPGNDDLTIIIINQNNDTQNISTYTLPSPEFGPNKGLKWLVHQTSQNSTGYITLEIADEHGASFQSPIYDLQREEYVSTRFYEDEYAVFSSQKIVLFAPSIESITPTFDSSYYNLHHHANNYRQSILERIQLYEEIGIYTGFTDQWINLQVIRK